MELGSEVESLFHRLAGLSLPEQRRALTEESISASVRAEVESLLAHDQPTGCGLDDVVHGAVAHSLESPLIANSLCGRYRLIELIGHGGMGSVYLAERVDGEVHQRVAVKLLRISMDTAEARQQFQKERQILADLSHPHIARLLDAGRADDGRPFLAMEFVDGTPIDDFCRELPLRDRVQLFEVLCGAIVYAHSMLVVHRDVKPGNVLVDATGAPKLLDFGIAKLMNTASDATATAHRRLTPQYASPEQILGRPVGAASDIFSLGSLLYILITGQPPFGYQDYPTRSELQRAVCESDPVRPGERNNKIDQDLEAIVRRAMRKEPDDRYESADALREDLRAWLQRKPVRARQGNWWYVARRQLRRHWIPATASAVTVAGLAIGLGIALHESYVAKNRFNDVHKLANEMLQIGTDIETLPGATRERERIAKTSLDYLERLSRDAGTDVDLEMDLGAGYRSIAEIQGGIGQLNLGRSDQAASSLQKSELFLEDARRQRPNDSKILRALMLTVDAQLGMDRALSRLSDLRQTLTQLHNLSLDFERTAPDTPKKWGALSVTYESLAKAASKLRETADSLRFAYQSVEFQKKLVAVHDNRFTRGNLAISLNSYGASLSSAGDLNGALRVEREGLAILNHIAETDKDDSILTLNIGASHSDIATRLNQIKELLDEHGSQDDEAVSELEQGLVFLHQTVHLDPSDNEAALNLAWTATELGRILQTTDVKRALAACDEAITVLRALPAQNARRNAALSTALSESVYPLCKLQRSAETSRRLAEATSLLAGTPATESTSVDLSTDPYQVLSRAQADQFASASQPAEAIRVHEIWLRRIESNDDARFWTLPDALVVADRYKTVAALYASIGELDKQQEMLKKRARLLARCRRNL
jgi:tetratricopeptide (TPR) repeat protein/predicted Ser/Thr protein kinase